MVVVPDKAQRIPAQWHTVALSAAAFIFSQTPLWLSLEKRKQETWLQIKVKIEFFFQIPSMSQTDYKPSRPLLAAGNLCYPINSCQPLLTGDLASGRFALPGGAWITEGSAPHLGSLGRGLQQLRAACSSRASLSPSTPKPPFLVGIFCSVGTNE